MTPEQIADIVKVLGVASPLVIMLWMQLREATEERKQMTKQFLETLQTTVAGTNQTNIRSAEALTELATTMREGQSRTTEEHNRLIDAIGKIGTRQSP